MKYKEVRWCGAYVQNDDGGAVECTRCAGESHEPVRAPVAHKAQQRKAQHSQHTRQHVASAARPISSDSLQGNISSYRPIQP